jgi:signal transduction histidine kinase
VGVLEPGRADLTLVGGRGLEGGPFDGARTLPLDARTPLADAAREATPVWMEIEDHPSCAVPLSIDDRTAIGSVAVGWSRPHPLEADERTFLQVVGRLCAQALDRARLFEELQRSNEQLRFLADAGEILASSMDVSHTLAALARLAVPRLADWCSVEMLDERGVLQSIEVAHVDPSKVAFARELRSRYPPAELRHEPALYPEITPEMIDAGVRDAEHARLVKSLSLRSVLILPLRARDRTLGSLTLVHAESGRRHDQQDLALGVEIARRAAIAIDNAQLYRAEQVAHARADRLLDRVQRVQNVTAALVSAPTAQAVLDTVLREAIPSLGAVAGVLAIRIDERTLEVVGSAGFDEETIERNRRFEVGLDLPLPRAVRDGRPIFISSPEEAAAWPRIPASARKAWAALPLIAGGHVGGGLWIAFGEPHDFTPEERDFMVAIAQQSAGAVERARLLESERVARRNVEEALRVRDEFLSVASHELKTPITGVSLQVQSLLRAIAKGETPSLDRLAPKLRSAGEQVHRLTTLVDDLLDVSRLGSGRMPLEMADVDLSAVAQEVAARFEDELTEAACPLELHAGAPVMVRGDRTRLDQVTTNLLTNAIKYGRGAPIGVEVSVDGSDGVLVVRDRGIGVPPEAQARIFERFERAVDSKSISGFGLGLWIVRNLLALMDGSIGVESTVGQGSTFVVRLPLAHRASVEDVR